MGRIISLIPRVNKTNGQINIALPKKKLPKKIRDEDFLKLKKIKLKIEDFEWEF